MVGSSVGKDACSLLTPLSHVRMGLGPGTLPYQEMKSPHSLCWAYHLCENIFPCYKPNICSFFLRKHLANPTVISVLCGEHTCSFHYSMRGGRIGQLPFICAGKHPLAMGDWHPLLKQLLQSKVICHFL